MWTLHANGRAVVSHRSLWRLLRKAHTLNHTIIPTDARESIARTGHYRKGPFHIFRAYTL